MLELATVDAAIALDCFLPDISADLLMLPIAEICAILDISEGTLAGRQCPLKHKLGVKKDILLGGQKFVLKVNEV